MQFSLVNYIGKHKAAQKTGTLIGWEKKHFTARLCQYWSHWDGPSYLWSVSILLQATVTLFF